MGREDIIVTEPKQSPEELQAGAYHYEADSHSLSLHKTAQPRPDLARASPSQDFIVDADVDIIICALHHRTSGRYGKCADRYVHMEVGHPSQNVHLQAVALGLATVEIVAFHDEEVRKILDLEEQIGPLYMMHMGRPP